MSIHLLSVYHTSNMLRIDGKIYLAYSGTVRRNSIPACFLKRAWESLRRNAEFVGDCERVRLSPALQRRFTRKWGVALTAPKTAFDEIVGDTDVVKLDDSETFDDMFRRLYGDSFYEPDRVVQCNALDHLYGLIHRQDFERLSAIARGTVTYNAPLDTLRRHSPEQSRIEMTIDVDQNPIAILYKVQFIIRTLREARAQAAKAEPLSRRIKQQLKTLEKKLDCDLLTGGKRNFKNDDQVFMVWDCAKERKSDTEIAKIIWPDEYLVFGGRDTATGDKGRLVQRVHHYKARAAKWIQQFGDIIKDRRVVL